MEPLVWDPLESDFPAAFDQVSGFADAYDPEHGAPDTTHQISEFETQEIVQKLVNDAADLIEATDPSEIAGGPPNPLQPPRSPSDGADGNIMDLDSSAQPASDFQVPPNADDAADLIEATGPSTTAGDPPQQFQPSYVTADGIDGNIMHLDSEVQDPPNAANQSVGAPSPLTASDTTGGPGRPDANTFTGEQTAEPVPQPQPTEEARAAPPQPLTFSSGKRAESRKKRMMEKARAMADENSVRQEGPPSGIREREQTRTEPHSAEAAQYADIKSVLEEVSAKLEEIEAAYREKVRAKTATREDELSYLNAKKALEKRKALLQVEVEENEQSDGAAQLTETEEADQPLAESPMFVQSPRPGGRQQKRARSEQQTGEESRTAKRARLAAEKKISRRQVNNGISVEIENRRHIEDKKKGRKKKDGTKKSQRTSSKGKSKSSKTAQKTRQVAKPRKTKGKKALSATFNGASMWSTRDIGASANRSLDKPDVATFTATTKDKAFAELVASVPLADKRMVSVDKKRLLEASIFLGPRRCLPDGQGGFRLRGMVKSLMPFQVIGAALMKEKEMFEKPPGGLYCDEAGLGKTLQLLSLIRSNLPPLDAESKVDLVVAPPGVLNHWMEEVRRHIKDDALDPVVLYHGNNKLAGLSPEKMMQNAKLVLTTYDEVRRSFVKWDPPAHCQTREEQENWYAAEYEEKRGVLHRVHFRRCICDEATAFKGRDSLTFKAIKAIDAQIRWAVTATPAMNDRSEFYPYLSFVGVKQAGRFDIFKKNFLDPEPEIADGRLAAFLRSHMIRRVHDDILLGAPLLKLPENKQYTVQFEFSDEEKVLYRLIKKKYMQRINQFQRQGEAERHRRTILTWLLRLRQLCSHPFLVQAEIEDLIDLEDIEALWRKTEKRTNILFDIRQAFKQKWDSTSGEVAEEEERSQDINTENLPALVLEYRTILRRLRNSEHWDEALERSLCTRCSLPPSEPMISACLHLFCRECLDTLIMEAAYAGEDVVNCLHPDCEAKFRDYEPCSRLQELRTESASPSPDTAHGRRQSRSNNSETQPKYKSWMEIKGKMIQSTKTAGVLMQVRKWLAEDNTVKIVVFSQFNLVLRILERIFQEQQIGTVRYDGTKDHKQRAKAIENFKSTAASSPRIMLCGLRCGGIGLNLTMASKAILIESWWNIPLQTQCFSRILRIGQERDTEMVRLLVKDSVDQKLDDMGRNKAEALRNAYSPMTEMRIRDLVRLFGDEDGENEFIYTDQPDEIA